MAVSQLPTILVASRCVLGGIAEPLRVAPARVVIGGDRILEIETGGHAALAARTVPTGARVIDLGDRLLTPAFINGHTHLAMAAFRGVAGLAALRGNVVEDLFFHLERELSAAEVRAFTRLGAYESLLAGVGTVFDHYYQGEAVAEALSDVGLTGVVAPTLQDLAGPGQAHHRSALAATLAIDECTRLRTAGVVAAVGPHATDTVSAALWREAAALAEARRLPLHTHVAQSPEEFRRAADRHQTTPLGWLEREGVLTSSARLLLVHGLYVTDQDLARLDGRRHLLGLCPHSQLEFGFPAAVDRWQAARLPWLVATDCAASNDSMNVQKELRLVSGLGLAAATFSPAAAAFRGGDGALATAARLESARTDCFDAWAELRAPKTLLGSVWGVPGQFHAALPCGALEVGRLANLLVVDPHHPALWPTQDPLRALVMGDVAPALEWMMLRGEFVGRRGDFHRSVLEDGYAEARAEANARLGECLARAGLAG